MFRFTIRDVLWLTVVVAVSVVAWQIESSRTATHRSNADLLKENAALTAQNKSLSRILRDLPTADPNSVIRQMYCPK